MQAIDQLLARLLQDCGSEEMNNLTAACHILITKHLAENAALKEQVAQLELVKDEHDERGIDIDILVRNLNSAEAQLTTLQSKSAALVDAMNKVSMLLCEANPNCSQEYLFGVITGTHTVSEAALAAFKGEK